MLHPVGRFLLGCVSMAKVLTIDLDSIFNLVSNPLEAWEPLYNQNISEQVWFMKYWLLASS